MITYPDGSKDEAYFKYGKAQGVGYHTWPDGERSEVEFVDGKFKY
ncbi:MAG: hypothetical protein IKP04_03475 [Candidatus Methanomethylophilaceae archaeon]|nr:hypothetical protein [Candidatus Methanomethylophilaceae archaeon]